MTPLGNLIVTEVHSPVYLQKKKIDTFHLYSGKIVS